MASRRKKDGPVTSNPRGELAVRNAKYVKNCTELYMADREIEIVANFDKFVNLEVLWLNNNHLQRIDGLDANFRIKKLYVHNNRIRSLVGSLSKFTFLVELHAHNNEIANLQACLAALSHMHHIKTLNLFNNPVAEEDNYRLQVIAALPSASSSCLKSGSAQALAITRAPWVAGSTDSISAILSRSSAAVYTPFSISSSLRATPISW